MEDVHAPAPPAYQREREGHALPRPPAAPPATDGRRACPRVRPYACTRARACARVCPRVCVRVPACARLACQTVGGCYQTDSHTTCSPPPSTLSPYSPCGYSSQPLGIVPIWQHCCPIIEGTRTPHMCPIMVRVHTTYTVPSWDTSSGMTGGRHTMFSTPRGGPHQLFCPPVFARFGGTGGRRMSCGALR